MRDILSEDDIYNNKDSKQNSDIYNVCWNYTKINQGFEQKLNNLRIDTMMFLIYFTTYSNMIMSRFKWSTNSKKSRLIEKLLYYWGSCALVKIDGELKPYKYLVKEWNTETGEPKRIDIFDLFGKPVKQDIKEKNFVIIYDNIMNFPKVYTVYNMCCKMARTQRAIDSNVKKQFIPILLKGNPEQKKALETLAKKYEQGVDYWFCDEGIPDMLQALNLNVDFKGVELYDILDKQKNELQTLVGIDNENVNKQSGVSTEEIEANDDFIERVNMNALLYRKEACDECKEVFGVNMEVFELC